MQINRNQIYTIYVSATYTQTVSWGVHIEKEERLKMTTKRWSHLARPTPVILSNEDERCRQKVHLVAQLGLIGGSLLMIVVTWGGSLIWLHLKLQPLLAVLGQ